MTLACNGIRRFEYRNNGVVTWPWRPDPNPMFKLCNVFSRKRCDWRHQQVRIVVSDSAE
jgi:hypothetical protein